MPDSARPLTPSPTPEDLREHDPRQQERQLRDMAARLMSTIGVARVLVRGGRTLDLAGIDDGVGLLCAQALDLPVEQGQALCGLLRDVLADIDSLLAALRDADSAGPAGRCGS